MHISVALPPNDKIIVKEEVGIRGVIAGGKVCVGNKVGDDVGRAEGFIEGLPYVGIFVGDGVGIKDGIVEGTEVGTSDGLCDVGIPVVGISVGE